MSIIITVSGLNENYCKALEGVGLCATENYFLKSDGLLLAGGGDIAPCAYGEVNKTSFNVDVERDQREFYLLRKFLGAKKPILGICRGLQVINVFFGGTLFQDVKNHSQIGEVDRRIQVQAVKGSFLEETYGSFFTVNCAHHQSIKKTGRYLKIAAKAEDGVIEAIECKKYSLIATQFHPERMGTSGLKLFEYFKSFFNLDEKLK